MTVATITMITTTATTMIILLPSPQSSTVTIFVMIIVVITTIVVGHKGGGNNVNDSHGNEGGSSHGKTRAAHRVVVEEAGTLFTGLQMDLGSLLIWLSFAISILPDGTFIDSVVPEVFNCVMQPSTTQFPSISEASSKDAMTPLQTPYLGALGIHLATLTLRFSRIHDVAEPKADPERDQRTVFAYQMPLKATETDVYEFFSKAGKPVSFSTLTCPHRIEYAVQLPPPPHAQHDDVSSLR
ncbi:hypothetical protein JHK84_044943 [Glycine max]|nr:hypothetical protein JHK86_044832 [Glycine max]KAG5108036.1 hypothetical protein JHK84_044943 [Glycine max]